MAIGDETATIPALAGLQSVTKYLVSLLRGILFKGDLINKRRILSALGSHFILKDKKLSIEPNSWLQPIANGYKELESEYLSFAPEKRMALTGINNAKSESESSLFTRWWSVLDKARTHFQLNPDAN